MKELLEEKIKNAKELQNLTKEIVSKSLKVDYMVVESMIDERRVYIEKIDKINAELKAFENYNYIETNEIEALKKESREIFKEISELDNIIRKNINEELKNVNKSLNQPEINSKFLNIKA